MLEVVILFFLFNKKPKTKESLTYNSFQIYKGSKLEEAAALCENGPAAGRRRGKGKGKGKGKGQKKCPTVEDVWNKVQEDMGGKRCILHFFDFA